MSVRTINHSEIDVDARDVEMRSCEVKSIRPLDGRHFATLCATLIFLSHSGSQTPFVEQLYWDLRNRGHTLFFDKSSHSLPTGEAFPKLILEAARQCAVAVVVLSKQYLMSKWPMLELVAFVDAQRTCNPKLRILPLFYKLDVRDLKDIQRWKTGWQTIVADDARFDPCKCEDALRVLAGIKGERFSKHGGSEVRYRKAVVARLYQLSRPYLKYSTPSMVGRTRLCQIIRGELDRQSRANGGRPAVLGLHGLGGMGKTLLCKALCSDFREEYAGRVCHVECSKSSGTLELQNLVLDELTDVNKYNVPLFKTSEEALMSISLNLPREAVFLAVDNVQEGDVQWLQSIFNCNHNPKSKFVVTSRCSSTVQSILRNKDLCWSIPSLTEHEALELFIGSAVPTRRLKIPPSYFADQRILNVLKDCIKECFFSKHVQGRCSQNSVAQGHYSPMLLQSLGSSIQEEKVSNPQQFIQKCRMWGKLQPFHKHAVFEILRTGYDALHNKRCKLLFLDIALFAPREKLRKLDDLCTWLQGMHDCSRKEIFHALKELRKRSLIEDWEANTQSQITLHDLYKDFAAYELQEVEEDNRWAVYHKNGPCGLPQNLESSPPGQNWPNLVRVDLRIEHRLPGAGHQHPQPNHQLLQSIVLASSPVMFPSPEKIQQWENLQLLCLEGFESPVLDITPLKCLRSLKLVSYELRTLKGCDTLEQLRFVELNCSGLQEGFEFPKCSKLQELVTGEIYSLRNLHLPTTSGLQVFKLHGWNKGLPVELDLGHHLQLREFAIAHSVWDTGRAGLWGSWSLSILGLQFLTGLAGLTLIKLPIRSLPGLENLVALEFLNLRGCAKLEMLPDLSTFFKLAWVDRHGCEKLPHDQPLVSRECRVIGRDSST